MVHRGYATHGTPGRVNTLRQDFNMDAGQISKPTYFDHSYGPGGTNQLMQLQTDFFRAFLFHYALKHPQIL